MIGLTAPISGRLYEKFGSRKLTTVGMTFSSAAILLLADGSARMNHDPVLLGTLALFGIGLGIYIAPNNAATMEAAPEGRSAAAGGLLNLMRVLGCMGGIVIASSAISWRLRVDTGFSQRTMEVSTSEMMNAIHQALWALLFFSILAGSAALLKNGQRDKINK